MSLIPYSSLLELHIFLIEELKYFKGNGVAYSAELRGPKYSWICWFFPLYILQTEMFMFVSATNCVHFCDYFYRPSFPYLAAEMPEALECFLM